GFRRRQPAAVAVGGGAGGASAQWQLFPLGIAGGGCRRQHPGLGAQLAARSLHRALPRAALVPRHAAAPRTGAALVSPLRPLVAAAELAAGGRRPADADRRGDARTLVELSADRRAGQDLALSAADRSDPGLAGLAAARHFPRTIPARCAHTIRTSNPIRNIRMLDLLIVLAFVAYGL